MDAFEIQHERDTLELELALLRRGVKERKAKRRACARCDRTPLVGERVYMIETGVMVCELCRSGDADAPLGWTFVRGPEFGHTLKLLERDAA
jgi:hypothetical protein